MRRGVRYYRAVPPPEGEWEADYAAIARAGFDFVVVPVPWSSSHLGDDQFDFSPLVRQLDLARDNGLGIVAAVDLGVSPGWLTDRHPECLHVDASGLPAYPRAMADAPGGGWPGLCLDHGIARTHARRFLQALGCAAPRHPALEGYGISGHRALERLGGPGKFGWYCHCLATRGLFVSWLRRAYGGDLDRLSDSWRVGHRDWAEVASPPAVLAGWPRVEDSNPQTLDWLRFLRDNAAAQFRWCVESLREADRETPQIAMGRLAMDDWTADPAALPQGLAAWGWEVGDSLPHTAADQARAAAPAPRVWVTGIPTRSLPAVRTTSWSLLCSGAEAAVFDAWRPEPFAGICIEPALARPGGAPSPRLEEIARFARWLSQTPELAAARPAPAEVAIVVVPESQEFFAASHLGPHFYPDALQGVYQAMTSRGARAELVRPDGTGAYALAYVAMAHAMSAATAEALRRYVAAGGCLVAEACTARFDERGMFLSRSPGHGLHEVFGARAPDVAEDVLCDPRPMFKGRRGSYPCYRWREPLEATTGRVKATFIGDGTAAIVDHAFGAGTARLIGTHPSYGCLEDEKSCAQVILDSLAYAKVRPRVATSSPAIVARLLEGGEAHYLCAFNPTASVQDGRVAVSRSVGAFRSCLNLVTGKSHRVRNNAWRVRLAPAEGVLLRLDMAPARRRWPRVVRGAVSVVRAGRRRGGKGPAGGV